MTEKRHPQALPEPKSERTVTFVGPDGNELEVVSNISKAGLAVLKRQGFRKQSEVFKEQEERALEKDEKVEAEDGGDDEDSPAPRKAPAKKAPPRSQG